MKKKVLSLSGVVAKVRAARRQKKKIVTTNGCFDILHVGHVTYLEQARQQGDLLIVGVNSDASVRENKDSGRPINGEKARAAMLAGLEAVNYVFIFNEKDPRRFLGRIKPDVHIKGGDYQGRILEQDIVEQHGGRVKLLRFVPGFSTTSMIEKIVRVYGPQGR